LSENRIIAFRGYRRLIATNFADPRFLKISFSVDNDVSMISRDASLYRSDWSGEIEYRFKVTEATRIAAFVRAFMDNA